MESPRNRDFYGALQLQRNATEEEIKKAYRRMALKYHPDKAGNGAEAAAQFELIQKSYETLSDFKLRRIYDQYGEKGLEMLQSMGPFIDPEAILQINRIFTGFSFVIGLLIVFPSLLSARIEENITWSYILVFIPLFIVDAIVLILIISSAFDPTPNDDPQLETERKKSIVSKIVFVVYVSLFCTFQFLICAKLDNIALTSWWVISIPWFILELMNLVQITTSTISQAGESIFDSNESNENTEPRFMGSLDIFFLVLDNFSMFIVRTIQASLIFWKLNGASSDWRIIFLPTWLIGGVDFLRLSYSLFAARREAKPEPFRIAIFKLILFLIWAILFYTFMGLLVNRLESDVGVPTAAVIFIPIFIVLSILFCCFCFCLPCSVFAARQQFEEDMMDNETQLEVVVASDHRITVS
jgi:hypothetical protein